MPRYSPRRPVARAYDRPFRLSARPPFVMDRAARAWLKQAEALLCEHLSISSRTLADAVIFGPARVGAEMHARIERALGHGGVPLILHSPPLPLANPPPDMAG